MKALTICQPYAELICRGEKRVENRTWPTMYRGPILIHAGKSRAWLDAGPDVGSEANYGIPVSAMAFGAVVATAQLVNCVRAEAIHSGKYDDIYPWAKDHYHVNGPWCWILDNVKRVDPVPYRGAQGLFDIPWPEVGS